MADRASYFQIRHDQDGEVLVPLDTSSSLWSASSMRGPAVSGALARSVERLQRDHGREDLRAARWTVDLCAPSPTQPTRVSARVLQESGRLLLVSAELSHAGRTSARARALFLKPTANAQNETWRSESSWELPPSAMAFPSGDPWLYHSDANGWSASQTDCQDASRKSVWMRPIDVVEEEPISPFQSVASLADLASLVTNWGRAGVAHINADLTMAIARLPESVAVGLGAVQRVESDGIVVGVAEMFDDRGAIGSVMVTALANEKRRIDLAKETPPVTLRGPGGVA
jgi:hypothetical protein